MINRCKKYNILNDTNRMLTYEHIVVYISVVQQVVREFQIKQATHEQVSQRTRQRISRNNGRTTLVYITPKIERHIITCRVRTHEKCRIERAFNSN